MNVGDRVVLQYVNRATLRWHRVTATVTKVDPLGGRARFTVISPGLPYPAEWDMRRLLGNEEVWVDDLARSRVLVGRPSGAAGRNLTLSGLGVGVLPVS